MSVVIVTGSAGLIGSETCRFFSEKGLEVVGIDNDMRKYFFGERSSTAWNTQQLKARLKRFAHHAIDIRDSVGLANIFQKYGKQVSLVVHTAAQPSHDWAAREPETDFTINANGTLNLLEATRKYAPEATFIFTSTNKVYGDVPNDLPLIERESRWEINETHPFSSFGIDETMSIDHSKHSLFGVSKTAADLLTQEYGRYFGMKTAIFRGGCLTGPAHSGAELHGFLAYLAQCVAQNRPYTVYGYKGKQVRDNIHAYDLVNAFWHFFQRPKVAAVYNLGGSRHSHCSVLEAIQICERLSSKRLNFQIVDAARSGDHIWWVTDVRKFQRDFPEWTYKYNLETILAEILDASTERAAA